MLNNNDELCIKRRWGWMMTRGRRARGSSTVSGMTRGREIGRIYPRRSRCVSLGPFFTRLVVLAQFPSDCLPQFYRDICCISAVQLGLNSTESASAYPLFV